MDILLIRPNDAKQVYGDIVENAACEPPFWAAVIASYCRMKIKEVDISILDAEVYNMSPEKVVKYVKQNKPRMIIIVVTGTNLSASTWKMQGASICAKAIKEIDDIPMLMWGLHPSALPERTLFEEDIDYVIKGEGLQAIVDLYDAIYANNFIRLDSIKGLYYKDGFGEVKGNEEFDLCDEKFFPEPAWDLLPMERYRAHNWQQFGDFSSKPYGVIATSLGCPFRCSFCAVHTLFGNRTVRFFPAEKVIEWIDCLVLKYGIKYLKILDENFVLNKKHVTEICDLLISRNYNLNIWAYARIDTVDQELLFKMKRAGINWLAYGIESASELVLSDVSKNQYTVEKIENVIKMTKKADINVLANFMFGLPDDTRESMEETLKFARKINPEFINFYCTMAYPGSDLYKDYETSNTYLPINWLAFSQYSYECEPLATKNLTSKEVLAFRDFAFQAFFKDNEVYFDNIRRRFGQETVNKIKKMLAKKLNRKLLENGGK